MKLLKKILPAILVLVLAVLLLPADVEAASSGTCGENLTWEFSSGTLTISGTGPMSTGSTPPWYSYARSIRKIVLEEGVTTIAKDAFDDCQRVTEVHIPASITTIGNYAFRTDSDMEAVYIADLAAWMQIDFGGASANPLSVGQTFVKAYVDGQQLTDLVIPNGVTAVKPYVFYGYSLNSVTMPDSVITIGENAFAKAYIGTLTVGKSVQTIGDRAFYQAGLTHVVLPDSVTQIGEEAFYLCDDAESLTIGNGGTVIGTRAFASCGFKSVTVGTGAKSFADGAFNNTQTDSVYITDLGAWMENDFDNSSIGGSNPLYNGATLYLNGVAVTELTVPAGITQIKPYTFTGCASLTGVTVPEGVTDIGKQAFQKCVNLKTVTVSESNIDQSAFNGCAALESVTLGDGVATIGYSAFANCDKLKTVRLGSGIQTIVTSAFEYTAPKDVYYNGTREQWELVSVYEYGNANFLNATFHFLGEVMPGDVDGNEELTTDDAVYLLLSVMFGTEDYPVPDGTNLDFDGSGKVDTDDAVYLLLSVMFGAEDYPI